MTRYQQIYAALHRAFPDAQIELADESEQHRGHAGYQDGGESHFRVKIAAPEMAGMSRVARHRAVHAAIGPELMGQIHALALELTV